MDTEPINPRTSPSPTPQVEHLPARKLNKRFIAIIFLIVAVVLTIIGLREMYSYESEDKVVGGDAYNFIIMAGRGTGLICSGIVSALIGVAVSIWDLIDRQT